MKKSSKLSVRNIPEVDRQFPSARRLPTFAFSARRLFRWASTWAPEIYILVKTQYFLIQKQTKFSIDVSITWQSKHFDPWCWWWWGGLSIPWCPLLPLLVWESETVGDDASRGMIRPVARMVLSTASSLRGEESWMDWLELREPHVLIPKVNHYMDLSFLNIIFKY